MTKTDVFSMIVVVLFVTTLFCGHLGVTVSGGEPLAWNATAPEFSSWSEYEDPFIRFFINFGIVFVNIAIFLGWIFAMFIAVFQLCTFQVDGMPVFVSGIFTLFGLLGIWLLVGLIRGTGG